MHEFEEVLFKVDLIHEYRTWGLNKLEKARKMYERDASDMEREFGELHFIPLALCMILGNLLDELNKFEESKLKSAAYTDQRSN
jgi:hypothetical protein